MWLGISLHASFAAASVPKNLISDDILHNKICSYIQLFVQVCGSQRDILSPRVGCKLPRLHGLTHFSRQIESFGSAENFNGSYLESHLKTFVKLPGRTTRRTHSEFSLDIINRWSQHASIMQYIQKQDSYDASFTEREDVENQSDRSQNIKYPNESFALGENETMLKLSKVVFHYSIFGNDRSWYTCFGRNKERGIFHPFMTLDRSQKDELSRFLNREVKPSGITRVNCHYQVRVLCPSHDSTIDRPLTKMTFRCNPKYRSNPWFDWVNVEYSIANEDRSVASRLYMILSHQSMIDRNPDVKEIFTLVQSLKNFITPRYSDLTCWHSDELYTSSKVVSFSRSISGPTFVLPSIYRNNQYSQIEENILSNEHYIVIPPRESWSDIGWDHL